jgi:hypothetical protein
VLHGSFVEENSEMGEKLGLCGGLEQGGSRAERGHVGLATMLGFKTGSNRIEMNSNKFHILPNFYRSKKDIPQLEKN